MLSCHAPFFDEKALEKKTIGWDSPTMTVKTDNKRRVVLPLAKPGDLFDVQFSGRGKLILTKLEPVESRPAKVRIIKRDGFTVGILDQPINDGAIRDALSEFP